MHADAILNDDDATLPCAQLTEAGRVINEEHGPAISSQSEVHVMNGGLKMAQITVLGQGQEFRAGSNWHAGQKLVRVVFPLLHDQLALDLLELPQQHQTGDHV